MVPTLFEFTENEVETIFGQQLPTLFMLRSKKDSNAPFMKVFEQAAKE